VAVAAEEVVVAADAADKQVSGVGFEDWNVGKMDYWFIKISKFAMDNRCSGF
jgi:hypothetical protein